MCLFLRGGAAYYFAIGTHFLNYFMLSLLYWIYLSTTLDMFNSLHINKTVKLLFEYWKQC